MTSPETNQDCNPQPKETGVQAICLKDGELNKCNNAWRPRMKRSSPAKDPEMLQTEGLLRNMRAILNKLTPERFNRLVEQVLELNIDSEERLNGVVDLVFEKAIDEPSFSVMYGQLCHRLAHLKVQMAEKAGSPVTFRRLLLNRCQKEFDVERSDDVVVQRKQAKLDSSSSTTEREQLQEELEDVKNKARRRSVGLVKLIGELFKLKMLTAAIIFSCIFQLLKKQDEVSLQQLCTLLTTVGKELNTNGAKPKMDQMFNQITKLIEECQTSTQIRFMLQDVVALKEKNWVPRKADQGPKTILQVHKEAEMEQQEEQLKIMKQLFSNNDWRQAGTSVTSQDRHEETSSTAPTRLFIPRETPRISKWPQLDEEIQLRPQGLASWAQGCRGWTPAANSETRVSKTACPKPNSVLQSAPLSRLSTPPTRPRHVSAGKNTDMKQRHSETSEIERNWVEPMKAVEPVEPLKPVEQVEQVGPMETVQPVQQVEQVKQVEPVEPIQPVEQVEQVEQVEPLEPVQPVELVEQVEQVELLEPVQPVELVEQVEQVEPLEPVQPVEQVKLAEPLKPVQPVELVEPQVEQVEQVELVEPVAPVEPVQPVEQVEQVELVEPVAPVEPVQPVEQVEQVEPVEPVHQVEQQVEQVEQVEPLEPVQQVEQVELVEPPKPVQPVEQVERVELVEPVEPVQSVEQVEPVQPMAPVELVEAAEPLEPVCFSLFQATVEECQLNSSSFMGAVVKAVHQPAVNDIEASCLVDTVVLKKSLPLLRKYLESDDERQLQALYALQALNESLGHPRNFLRMLFDFFYDWRLISAATFCKWQMSRDDAEQKGKAKAIESTMPFFTFLRVCEGL
ncbi:eukaryotic translation initiation factor 4 gamma 3-like [Salarias fasciatus]|uniref:eukaryotic translation initiation factor 4 gamma 3-like n=1 Tax=Salarias fasciatus TaxID=181472 RepID=UPI0011769DC0|nr:eukaryotic translation initiation factor 4 gamma 3-like [Salarias fasciatus]